MNTKTLITLLLLTALITSFKKTEDWYLLETKSYKVLFPKKPTATTQDVDSKIGKLTLNLNFYEVPETEKDDNHVYLFNETTYPDSLISSDKKEILEEFFKNSIAGSVSNVHGTLLSEKNIEINGYPGREVRIDYQNGLAIIKMREYLVKNIVYMLETITETKKEANSSVDKFLNSFQLK